MPTAHRLIFHPYSSSTGNSLLEILIEEFSSDRWTKFQSSVAFLKPSGNFVDLLSSMEHFVQQNHKILMIFGCDLFGEVQGSDYEALKVLLETFEEYQENASFFLYHEKGRTFHPKIYLFSNEQLGTARLSIGSSNWSSGGLLGNVEGNILLDLNLHSENDLDLYNQIQVMFSNYWTELKGPSDIGQGFVKQVSLQNLEDFKPLLSKSVEIFLSKKSEKQLESTSKAKKIDPALENAENLFRGRRIKIPIRFRRKVKRISREAKTADTDFSEISDISNIDLENFYLAWSKSKLAASDAQRQKGHPTGGVRLTQAKWMVEGEIIDQTIYFRETVFGNLEWTVGVHAPKLREVAVFNATIRILGENYGQHEFKVSHKPSGEAGQGNYTTLMHWWGLTDLIKKLNLVGRKFELYAPNDTAKTSTYHIEIS